MTCLLREKEGKEKQRFCFIIYKELKPLEMEERRRQRDKKESRKVARAKIEKGGRKTQRLWANLSRTTFLYSSLLEAQRAAAYEFSGLAGLGSPRRL